MRTEKLGWMTPAAENAAPFPESAAEWVARIHSGSMSRDDQRALRAWLAASTENNREFLRAETVWRMCATLAGDPKVQAELARLRRQAGRGTLRARWSAAPRGRLSVAAAVLAIALSTPWLFAKLNTDWYETAHGEQSSLTLPDGSTILVNTDSRVGVRYTAQERRIDLDRGEAFFSVTRDPARPFAVHAGSGYARAVGTAFNVVLENETVTVAVLEGRVEVATRTDGTEDRIVLAVDESTSYGKSGKLHDADPIDASPQRIAAWRERKLHFENWPLERVVREHNRYAHKPIRIGAKELAQRRIKGIFRLDETELLVEMLDGLRGIDVIDDGEEFVLVASGAATDPHDGRMPQQPRDRQR